MSPKDEVTLTVLELFEKKGWAKRARSNGNTFLPNVVKQMQSAANLLMRCSDSERILVTDLLNRFEVYDLGHYPELLHIALSHLEPEDTNNITGVFILPGSKPTKYVKSGHLFSYLFREAEFRDYFPSQPQVLSAVSDLRKDRGPSLIIFADDFSGSGESVAAALNAFQPYRLATDRVLIVVAVIHDRALESIKKTETRVLYSVRRNRGISDHFEGELLSDAINNMQGFEAQLGPGDYAFGHKRCEGLEKMCRTPNNTFPIFWMSSGSSCKAWPAIFKR